MSMLNIEKQILATTIVFQELAPVLFSNLDEDSFIGLENQKIFKTMKELYETGNSFDRFMLLDLLPGSSDFLISLGEYTEGINIKLTSSFLRERIELIKRNRAKKALLSQILEEANNPFPDFEKITQIAESGQLIDSLEEKGDFREAINEYLKWKDKTKTGITLGFPSFDYKTGNYNYGELLAIMGRTTAGKTWVSLNIIAHLINTTDIPTGLFSLEMVKAAVIERMMQLWFNIYWNEIDEKRKSAELNIEEFSRHYQRNLKIYSRVYSVYEIAEIIKRDKLKIVFIDYLQLIKKGKEGRSRYEKVTYLTEEIKEIAKNQEVFIVMMVQITREGEGGWEPVTFDMARESGVIEENSDFIIGCWQPSLKEGSDEYWNDKLCMKLLKNKRGPIIGCEFSFDKNSRKIYEICESKKIKEKGEKNGKPSWFKN